MCAEVPRHSLGSVNRVEKGASKMSVLTVLAVIGIVVYVIGQQLAGSPLSGKRLIVLPAVVTGIGILDLSNGGSHPAATESSRSPRAPRSPSRSGLASAPSRAWSAATATSGCSSPARSVAVGGLLVPAGDHRHRARLGSPRRRRHFRDPADAGPQPAAQAAVVAPRAFAAGIPSRPRRTAACSAPAGSTDLGAESRCRNDRTGPRAAIMSPC